MFRLLAGCLVVVFGFVVVVVDGFLGVFCVFFVVVVVVVVCLFVCFWCGFCVWFLLLLLLFVCCCFFWGGVVLFACPVTLFVLQGWVVALPRPTEPHSADAVSTW